MNVGSGNDPPSWRARRHERRQALDVCRDVTVVTASVDSGVDPDADPDADPDKHGDQTQSRPIPAKIFNSDFYSDELALTLYCRQPACLT